MTDVELGWVAGIFDGEGCISMMKNQHARCKEFWYVRVTVSQVDVRMLHKLVQLCGGTVAWAGIPKKPTWRRQRKWSLTGPRAVEFLRLILPYLTTKREQAELAILSQLYRGRRGVKGSADLTNLRWLAKQLSDLKRVPIEDAGQSEHLSEVQGET